MEDDKVSEQTSLLLERVCDLQTEVYKLNNYIGRLWAVILMLALGLLYKCLIY